MEKDTSRAPSVISWSAAASWDLCPVAVLVCVEDAFSSRVCSVSGWKFFSSRSVGVAVQLGVGSFLGGYSRLQSPWGIPAGRTMLQALASSSSVQAKRAGEAP